MVLLLTLLKKPVSGSSDGRISKADAEKILKVSKDAGKVTEVEKATLAYVHKNYNLTEAAKKWF